MKRARYIFLLLFIPGLCFSQGPPAGRKFWQLDGVNGALQLGGNYRYMAGTTNEVYNIQQSSLLYGGVMLNTSSHFWHPNFLWIDLGAEYNPEIGKDLYLVVPDQAETRTLKKLDATATFFRQKAFNFGGFVNLNESYNNRENLSNIKSNSSNWGANMSWTNKILPVQINYHNGTWNDHEVETGRTFSTHQSSLEALLRKSFSIRDNNELRYTHNEFSRKDFNYARTANVSDIISLNNIVSFDNEKKYNWSSIASATEQRGNEAFTRIQADENLSLTLPKNLTLVSNYDFFYDERDSLKMNQHLVNTTLTHRLYQSLVSSVNAEYSTINHTLFKENNVIAGFEVRYEKKIRGGQLSLSYKFNWQNQQRNSAPVALEVQHEPIVLTDGEINLLNKPFVTITTVVITDPSGTIIYQPFFDYTVIQRGDYVEVQRVPGGQIPNGATVYADYVAMLPGSYSYNADFHHFSASVILFHRILELYYHYGKQDYFNLHTTEFLILNYFDQHTVGCRLEYKVASGGAEYEAYNSTILPYQMMHYWVVLQGHFRSRIIYSLNGNMRNYHMLADGVDQNYVDVTGKVGYMVGPQTQVSAEFGYRKQIGQGIDLNLLMGRAEVSTMFRQFQVHFGVEAYGRDYQHENTSFVGANLRIVRTFNWNRR
jgi:hypothetical protein